MVFPVLFFSDGKNTSFFSVSEYFILLLHFEK